MELVGTKNINDKKVSLDEINCKLYSERKKIRQYKYNIKITKMSYTGTKSLNLNKIASPWSLKKIMLIQYKICSESCCQNSPHTRKVKEV